MRLILFAMREEAEPTIKSYGKEKIHDYLYQNGNNLFLITGIGSLNATIKLCNVLNYYKEITEVFLLGTCTALKRKLDKYQKLDIFDAWNPSMAYNGNVDLTACGYQHGQLPQEVAFYETTNVNQFPSNKLAIVSVDQFVNTHKQVRNILKRFPNADLLDMESGAVAKVCFDFGIKLTIFKVISDSIFIKYSDFDKNLAQCAEILKDLYINLK